MRQEQDWIMRQIDMLIDLIARMIRDEKGEVAGLEQATRGEAGALWTKLCALLDEDRLNDAENLLFEELDPDEWAGLRIALSFYERLNASGDAYLDAHGFSREEIKTGLEDVMEEFGLPIP